MAIENQIGQLQIPGPNGSNNDEAKDWTIKKLPSETIGVSREAAKRSGMKINAWVGMALEKAAAENSKADSRIDFDRTSRNNIEEHILNEIEKLRAQNEDLVQTINSMSALLLRMYTKRD